MAAPKNSGGRARKSKTEVQAEFEKIREEAQQQRLDVDVKMLEAEKVREAEVKEAVADLTVDSIVQRIGGLGGEISKSLADVSSRLMTGANVLTSLREAVMLERKEIERLHKIDVAKTAIDQLVDEFSQTKTSLEKEITEVRANWAEEQESRDREKREFEETLRKSRAREKEEYEYQKALERKKEGNDYDEAQKQLERKNKEKQEALEKSWATREAALKEREEELARLRKESGDFPEKLKTEVDKAINDTLKSEEAKLQQDLRLLGKESELEKRLSELKIKTLEETVTRQYAQIENLSQRVEEAKKQVQDIAVKAIEGASGAKTLSHINQIAMEQAKTRGTTPS